MKGKFEQILDETRDFLKSRVILTAAELNIFTLLDERPMNAEELAEQEELDIRGTTRLLDCLVAMEFLDKQANQYRINEKSTAFSSHHKESVLPMILHLNQLWDSWSHLTDSVRQGINPGRKPMVEREQESVQSFIGAMHVVGRKLAAEIADSYDLSPFKKLLDVGGASGTYTAAFLNKNPHLRAVLFDLEQVVSIADERLTKEGFRDRVEIVSGDFYKDELPKGCDLALLSAIIHQNSPEENVALYKKVYSALTPGGVLLIRDHIMDASRTRPPAGALFALNMLVNTRGGDTYTFPEVKETLTSAGFVEIIQIRIGDKMDSLVEARKPVQ
jgi:predicted O-methyltransferase YrrM